MRVVEMTITPKMSEAHYAYCWTCDRELGCQYWALSKSVALHKSGSPGHKVILYRILDSVG